MDSLKQRLKRRTKLFNMVKCVAAPYFWYIDQRDQKRSARWLKHQESSWTTAPDIANDVTFSLLVPVYNTPEKYLREMVQSVLDQTYQYWQLILVDDCSPDKNVPLLLNEIAKLDERIISVRLAKNKKISGATNEALRRATGEFITLLDHDDLLHPRALESVAEAVFHHPDANFIYTDEAKITDEGIIYQPFIKPDWNPDLLRSVNYITHMTTIRRSLMEKIGGERSKYDGAQDWDLFIRATSDIDPKTIIHVPRVLYYWRTHQDSTAGDLSAKPYVIKAQEELLRDDAARHKQPVQINEDPIYHGQWNFQYNPTTHSSCQVTIQDGAAKIPDTTDEYVVFSENRDNIPEEALAKLSAEAARENIGLVIPKITNQKLVIENLRTVLSDKTITLINKLSRRSVTKHIYLTTRYNINECRVPVAMIKTSKLYKFATPGETISIQEISKRITQAGYLQVYDPHIIV